jgi:hypothetical protein
VLHDHALAAELLAVQLVKGDAGVLELHEAVPIFEVYFEEAAIAAKKLLDVLFPDVVAQACFVDAARPWLTGPKAGCVMADRKAVAAVRVRGR